MSITPFADSPRTGAWGDRPYAIIDLAGPSSYTVVTTASPPTGGQAVTPATFGLVAGLEGIFMVGASKTGTYGVRAMQATAYNQGQNNGTWIVQWFVLATGAEVTAATNLSSETVRLIAFGPY